MHELAICQSLVDQLNGIADEHPGKVITTIHLQIGPLSGVVPKLLQNAFPLASAGSAAESAQLVFEDSQITVHCDQCGHDTHSKTNNLVCSHCGNWQTQLVSGDELMLQQVVMESPEDLPKPTIH